KRLGLDVEALVVIEWLSCLELRLSLAVLTDGEFGHGNQLAVLIHHQLVDASGLFGVDIDLQHSGALIRPKDDLALGLWRRFTRRQLVRGGAGAEVRELRLKIRHST